MKRRRAKKKKKKLFIRRVTTLAVAIALIFVGYLYLAENSSNKVINEGVYIENINLSGKKLSDAEIMLNEKYGQSVVSKKVQIEVDSKTYVLDYSMLEAKYNISETVNEAFNYGKEDNIIKKYLSKKSSDKKEFKLSFTYNSKPIDELINKIEKETNRGSVDAKITTVNGTIKITPEVNGMKIQKDKLKQAIIDKIDGEHPQKDEKIQAPIEIIKPQITSEKLASINGRISSFGTSFTSSIANRINNIDLATKAINGTLLMPGETFSFNGIVGERTKERGYKEAGVIVGDKIESGLGGGICQVSSTLYNALLNTDIKGFERRNHSLPLSYVGKGLDATVDFGNIDFKFKNTLSSPIYIEGYTKNKNIYFNIYANQELSKKTYEMATDVYEIVQPTIKFIDDPNRNQGETEIVKKSAVGYKVKVYRKTFENGKLINTELISNDYYRAVDGETIRGTKPIAPNAAASAKS